MMIIDPPVTPFSSPDALRAWLAELAGMPQDEPEVVAAIEQAKRWLDRVAPTPNPEP
jgi:hypothetical protein